MLLITSFSWTYLDSQKYNPIYHWEITGRKSEQKEKTHMKHNQILIFHPSVQRFFENYNDCNCISDCFSENWPWLN